MAAPSPFNFRLANTEFLTAGTPVTRVERLPNRTSLRRPGEFGTSAFQSSVYDPYQQSQSEPSAKAQLRRLQGDYTVVDSNRCVIELLEEHPRLFALLVEGVQPLKSAFGEIFLVLPTRCVTIQEKAFRERRSGRAYYYICDLALMKAKAQNFNIIIGRGGGMYKQLWHWSQSHSNPIVRHMGIEANRMHSTRISADYKEAAIANIALEATHRYQGRR